MQHNTYLAAFALYNIKAIILEVLQDTQTYLAKHLDKVCQLTGLQCYKIWDAFPLLKLFADIKYIIEIKLPRHLWYNFLKHMIYSM